MAFTMQDFIREFSIDHSRNFRKSSDPCRRKRQKDHGRAASGERLASMSSEQIQKHLDKLKANKGPATRKPRRKK